MFKIKYTINGEDFEVKVGLYAVLESLSKYDLVFMLLDGGVELQWIMDYLYKNKMDKIKPYFEEFALNKYMEKRGTENE